MNLCQVRASLCQSDNRPVRQTLCIILCIVTNIFVYEDELSYVSANQVSQRQDVINVITVTRRRQLGFSRKVRGNLLGQHEATTEDDVPGRSANHPLVFASPVILAAAKAGVFYAFGEWSLYPLWEDSNRSLSSGACVFLGCPDWWHCMSISCGSTFDYT